MHFSNQLNNLLKIMAIKNQKLLTLKERGWQAAFGKEIFIYNLLPQMQCNNNEEK